MRKEVPGKNPLTVGSPIECHVNHHDIISLKFYIVYKKNDQM